MSSAPAERRLHALVSGRVQGVFYRRFVFEAARRLNLAGSARNLPDRRVEVIAEGPEPALRELVRQLHTGPPAARVEAVDESWSDPTGGCAGFTIG